MLIFWKYQFYLALVMGVGLMLTTHGRMPHRILLIQLIADIGLFGSTIGVILLLWGLKAVLVTMNN